MKRATKRRLSIYLSFILVLSLFYTVPSANPAKAAGYGLSNPTTDSEGVATWDCVYFGNYWQNDTNGDGVADRNDAKQPIKWRVLSVDGDDAFLLADQNLDYQQYNEEYTDVTWETCTLRQWLNNDFYQNVFDSSEQSAIRTTNVVNENNPAYGTEGGNNTSDKVYLLSISEASNAAYGFCSVYGKNSETREAKNTEYAKECGAYTINSGSYAGNGWWWVRSPGDHSIDVAYVSTYGSVSGNGCDVGINRRAVRPALHLNLSSSKWSKAGTVSSSGEVSGGETTIATATPDNGETPTPIVTSIPMPTEGETTTATPIATLDKEETSTPTVTPMQVGDLTNPRIDSDSVTTWDCVYFGNYWQNDTNGDGKADKNDAKQPIKWRVLSVDGDDAFLLADQNLDYQRYNEEWTDVTWETCTLRQWLNNDFYQNAFDSSEQSAVQTTAVVNEDNPQYGTKGGNSTSDNVYLLSIGEASNAAYGFHDTYAYSKTREAKNTEYANECGAFTSSSDSYAGNGWWWLRSPGDDSSFAADVGFNGYVSDSGNSVGHNRHVVRPALHLNLSSSKWSKAGTVSSSGEVSGGETATPTQNGNLSNPRTDSNGETTWDCVYFGNYWQNDTNGDGKADKNDAKQPIKWRVLSVDGDDAFLLADQNLDCQKYNEEYTDVTWETCTLRQWLNNDFYQNAFDGSEQSAIQTTTVINEDNWQYGTEGGNSTSDNVYLLSIGEARNTAYGFHGTYYTDSKTREAKNTEYAKECGAATSSFEEYAGNSWWWLRSPGDDSIHAAFVNSGGYVSGSGSVDGNDGYAVRPALHLNLSSSKWSKAGTVSSSGEVSGGEAAIATATPDIKDDSTQSPEPTATPTGEGNPIPTRTPAATPSPTAGNKIDIPIPPEIGNKVTAPAKGMVKKCKNKNGKKISLSWKKIKDARGYQIQYADNKKFKKKKSKYTKKTKYTIKKLKKKKTYYIRVRAYKLDGSKKVYGRWSKVKKVKVKK